MLKKQDEVRTNLLIFFKLTPTYSSISIVLPQPDQPQKTVGKKQIYFYLMYISLLWTDLISY